MHRQAGLHRVQQYRVGPRIASFYDIWSNQHVSLECSYGSQIKQSRRRNYLIHLEQKVQRLEHELRSARSVTDRRPSDVSIEQSSAHKMHIGVQDYSHVNQDTSAAMGYWNNSYKPFEQTGASGNGDWVVPAQPKPYLSQLLVPSQCVRSSDYGTSHRADSLSVSIATNKRSAFPHLTCCLAAIKHDCNMDTMYRRCNGLLATHGRTRLSANAFTDLPYRKQQPVESRLSTSIRRSGRCSRHAVTPYRNFKLRNRPHAICTPDVTTDF